MLHRWLLTLAMTVAVMCGVIPAPAQEEPPPDPVPLPVIDPTPSPYVPLPTGPSVEHCNFFGFCYQLSVLDGNTLALVGVAGPIVRVAVRDASGALIEQARIVHPHPQAEPFPNTLFGSITVLNGDDLFISGGEVGGSLQLRRTGSTWSFVPPLGLTVYAADHDTALAWKTPTAIAVYVRRSDGQYVPQGEITLPSSVGGSFSSRMALDGDVAVIAAADDGSGTTEGALFVFQRQSSHWSFVQRISAPAGLEGAGFGTSFDVDGRWIAVGVPFTASDPPGVVQTYERRGRLFVEDELLTNPYTDSQLRQFGTALDLEGRRLLVSGRTPYPFAPFLPMNILYEMRGNEWEPIAALSAGDANRVKISGNTALVDVIGSRGNGTTPVLFDLPR